MAWKTQIDPWTDHEVRELRKLASVNTPTSIIARRLDRSPRAVEAKATEENIILKSTSQSSLDEYMPIQNHV